MALSKVTFTRTDGNLGTALTGLDHISGLLFDTTSAPGTTSLGDVYQIFSVKEAEANGIKGKESTPFLLAKIKEITKGKSLEANIQLVYNNAKLASEIAGNMK